MKVVYGFLGLLLTVISAKASSNVFLFHSWHHIENQKACFTEEDAETRWREHHDRLSQEIGPPCLQRHRINPFG